MWVSIGGECHYSTEYSMVIHPDRSTEISPAISDTRTRPALTSTIASLEQERPNVPTKCFEWSGLDGG